MKLYKRIRRVNGKNSTLAITDDGDLGMRFERGKLTIAACTVLSNRRELYMIEFTPAELQRLRNLLATPADQEHIV